MTPDAWVPAVLAAALLALDVGLAVLFAIEGKWAGAAVFAATVVVGVTWVAVWRDR